jgi:hypothetical protein
MLQLLLQLSWTDIWQIGFTDFYGVPTIYLLLSFHCLMGCLAAVVAQSKGYVLERWLVIGLIGGTVALVGAIALKPQRADGDGPSADEIRKEI